MIPGFFAFLVVQCAIIVQSGAIGESREGMVVSAIGVWIFCVPFLTEVSVLEIFAKTCYGTS